VATTGFFFLGGKMAMSKEQLTKIIRAAMAAAKAIVAVTPNTTDDRIYEIAEVIVQQVLGIFGDVGVYLTPEEDDIVVLAARQIKAACDCDDC
jgi:hypothetical protein